MLKAESEINNAAKNIASVENNQLLRIKKPPVIIPTEGGLCKFTQEALNEGIEYVMKNKIVHVFDKEVHNLAPLVERLGGRYDVVREVVTELSGKVHVNEIFENLKINVAGFDVYVRGRIMNGIPKIGTFFIR